MMSQTVPEVGIKIYTPSPRSNPPQAASASTPASPSHGRPIEEAPPAKGAARKKRAVSKGVQKTLKMTSLLANFLPTGTLLTFEMLLPSASGDGSCGAVNTRMIQSLLAICSLSCFFFHFTDSFMTPDGKTYYGFVTPSGLSLFKTGAGVEIPNDEKYKIGISDFVHAFMSVVIFMAIATWDDRITNCLFPGHAKNTDLVMESLPLIVGIFCSGLFLVFPTSRHGIGFMSS